MAERFSKPYVTALFDVAGSVGEVETHLPALQILAAAVELSEELRVLLKNPGVERRTKQAILEGLAARAGLSGVGLRLAKSLLVNRRAGDLPRVVEAIRERLDREHNIVEAVIESAVPLLGSIETGIRTALEEGSGRNVRLRSEVDPSLLAGFVVRLGSEVYDASLAHRLEKARQAIHRAPTAGA